MIFRQLVHAIFLIILVSLGSSDSSARARQTAVAQSTIVTVTADNMAVNGDTKSVDALINAPGDDGISFREALLAVNNTGPGFTINFNLPHCTSLFFSGTLSLTAANTTIDGDVNGDGFPDILFQSPDNTLWLDVLSDNNVFRRLIFKQLRLSGADNNQIHTSYIGTGCDGAGLHPAIGNGIEISGGHSNTISNSIIAGNTVHPTPVTVLGYAGIIITNDASNNEVRGNLIGLNIQGEPLPNDLGIVLDRGAHDNLIGGFRNIVACNDPCNIISGNNWNGVQIGHEDTVANSDNNKVQGNYIGVGPDGKTPIPNSSLLREDRSSPAVTISNGASGNVIGGERSGEACTGPCNVISGNASEGIWIHDAGSDNNQILGNFIGVGADGSTAVANKFAGIRINDGAASNVIGGDREVGLCTGPCNVISGNERNGVVVRGEGSNNNQILGNYIGLNATGTDELPNGDPLFDGSSAESNFPAVWIGAGASHNIVGGERSGEACSGPCNVVSGNKAANLYIGGQYAEANTTGNMILGNFIGVTPDGTAGMNNLNAGVIIASGATETTIGGSRGTDSCTGPCNVIGNNPEAGILIVGVGTTNNQVQGNFIGANISAHAALANAVGVDIAYGAQHNLIGGLHLSNSCNGPCNLIIGNDTGLRMLDEATQRNDVQGNHLLVNGTGIRIDGASNNVIGGSGSGSGCRFACNVISHSLEDGIVLGGSANTIQGNYIGVNPEGTAARANGGSGIVIDSGASQNLIGGNRSGVDCTGLCNVISGNSRHGIYLLANASSNEIAGNYIGLSPDGTTALPNNFSGLSLLSADNNLIGGRRTGVDCNGSCNVIAGNLEAGVLVVDSSANRILGNIVGLNPTGTAVMANGGSGIDISGQSNQNLVGGLPPGVTCHGPCNLISGNQGAGVALSGNEATGNTVSGNYIGVDVTGQTALSNTLSGVQLDNGANGNVIGGARISTACTGSCNVISGNDQAGVVLNSAHNNQIAGNIIGLDATGTAALPNAVTGVILEDGARQNMVGGPRESSLCNGSCNVINSNQTGGVVLQGVSTDQNSVLGNVIVDNAGLGIDLGGDGVTANDSGDGDSGPNQGQNYPVLLSAVVAGGVTIQGSLDSVPNTLFRLEFFANDSPDPSGFGEGMVYLGSVNTTTDNSGTALFSVALPASGLLDKYLSATATDPAGNTSEFAQSIVVGLPSSGLTVNSTDDLDDGLCNSGHCSLREALNTANGLPGIDLIQFDILGTGPHTIQPNSALPAVSDPVVIDGTSEPDFTGAPIVVIDGVNAGTAANGLEINAGHSRVQGLILQNFAGHGLLLSNEGGNEIVGNFIGTAADGLTNAGNGGTGIQIEASDNNTIGGETAELSNVIAFNGGDGITVLSGVGHWLSGNALFDNGDLGIDLGDDGLTNNDELDLDEGANGLQNFPALSRAISQPGQTTVAGTLSSSPEGFFRLEFFASESCDPSGHGEGAQFLGSISVTSDSAGLAAFVAHLSVEASVGTAVTAIATDLLSNNTSEFSSCVDTVTADYVVNALDDGPTSACDATHCNLREAVNAANATPGASVIAFNIAGAGPHEIFLDNALPSVDQPIVIDGTTEPDYQDTPVVIIVYNNEDVTPGLTLTAGNNTIRGLHLDVFETAIHIIGSGNNTVVGNIIRGEFGSGIFISDSSNNVIGGITPGASNEIAGDDSGVTIDAAGTSLSNVIRGNTFQHTFIAIDLNHDGITLNDEGDADSGANSLQNYPLITSLARNDNNTIIGGSLNSTPNTSFDLDFYATNDCQDAFVLGGPSYLGTTVVDTGNEGNGSFEITLPVVIDSEVHVRTTATDPDGNTSELSVCYPDSVRPFFPDDPLKAPPNGSQSSDRGPNFDWEDAGPLGQAVQYGVHLMCVFGEGPNTTIEPCPFQSGLRSTLDDNQGGPAFTFVTQESEVTPPFDLPFGTYAWTVVAINEAGLASEPIKPFIFVIEPEESETLFLPLIFK